MESTTRPTPPDMPDTPPTPDTPPVSDVPPAEGSLETTTPVIPSTAPVSDEPNFFQSWYNRGDAYVRANPRRSLIIAGVILLLILSFFVRVAPPHVSLAGEPILANGPAWFTNSLLTTFIVDIVVLVLALLTVRNLQLVPGGLQNVMEMVIEYLYNLAESVAGRAGSIYFPWAATIFLLVLASNWLGILPFVGSLYVEHSGIQESQTQEHSLVIEQQLAMADGKLLFTESAAVAAQEEVHTERVPLLRPPTADLSMTLALALSTMIMVQYYGVNALGAGYFRKFWNTSGHSSGQKAINLFVSILEFISELSRLLTLTFRLFGNIFAGEVVLATMAFLFAFLVPLPFYALEVLVGVIQAFVFTILSLMYFSMATVGHGHAEEHH